MFFTPECFGHLRHIAVVFDQFTQEFLHYASGDLRRRSRLKEVTLLKIGIAELGNWNDSRNQGGAAIRHLSSTIDEFALWDRVVSDVKIASLTK